MGSERLFAACSTSQGPALVLSEKSLQGCQGTYVSEGEQPSVTRQLILFHQGVGYWASPLVVFPAWGSSALLAQNWKNGWGLVEISGHPRARMEDSGAAQDTGAELRH